MNVKKTKLFVAMVHVELIKIVQQHAIVIKQDTMAPFVKMKSMNVLYQLNPRVCLENV